jgi:ATP-dependent DNA ligase
MPGAVCLRPAPRSSATNGSRPASPAVPCRLERATSPLPDAKGIPAKGVHWVRPELVAQVGFAEWTPDGKLRHPRYLGLRDDKSPDQIVREGG